MNDANFTSLEHGDVRRPKSAPRPRPGSPVRGYYLRRGCSDKQFQAIDAYMSATSEFGVLIEPVDREKKVNVFSFDDAQAFEEKYSTIIDATFAY